MRNDYISRQALLTAIQKAYVDTNGGEDRQKARINVGLTMALNLVQDAPSIQPKAEQEPKTGWIPVSERLPETDNKNSINNYNVLLWVKDKNEPEDEPQIYLGKLRKVAGDDGSHNFWGIKTEPCDWTIWGWSYFHEPEVIAWMPLPPSYQGK